jgi:arsenate reductase-like glutaredoxin family protein
VKELVKASGKNVRKRDEALELVGKVDTLIVAKGHKLDRFDVKDERPDDDVLAEHLLGRTGNMRAPALLVGNVMLVGFNADVYTEVFEG